jgi:hypothetical protein
MTDKPIEQLREQIPRFLRGGLNQAETRSFQDGLASYPELQTEMNEMRQLLIGLEVTDRLFPEHPDSADLVALIYHPQQLDRELKKTIEEHLQRCCQCREEYELGTEAMLASIRLLEPARATTSSLLGRLRNMLLPPQFVMQPALAYLVIILLALPTYLGVRSLVVTHPSIVPVELHESGTRGDATTDEVTIAHESDVAKLLFPSFPARSNYHYNLLLEDRLGRVISAWYDVEVNRPKGFDVPATLLLEDTYQLEFEEISPSGTKTGSFAPTTLKVNRTK